MGAPAGVVRDGAARDPPDWIRRGEAGIGKTALVEAFVSGLALRGTTRVARGQCIEHYGAGEAYLPILEAIGRLGRDTAAPVADILRRYAPTWLAHLPSEIGQ